METSWNLRNTYTRPRNYESSLFLESLLHLIVAHKSTFGTWEHWFADLVLFQDIIGTQILESVTQHTNEIVNVRMLPLIIYGDTCEPVCILHRTSGMYALNS